MFCDIAAGRAEATVVWHDEATVVFADVRPVNPGHVLVVPNIHAERLEDLDETSAAELWRTVQRVAAAVRATTANGGVNLLVADGEAAGQEVPHLHVHVIPRHRGDGFAMDAPAWREPPPTRQALEDSVEATRAALSS